LPHRTISPFVATFTLPVGWDVDLKVLEWADHHKDDPVEEKEDESRNKKSTDIDDWDQKFMQVDQEMLFEIILVRHPNSFLPKWVLTTRLQIIWISNLFLIPDARLSQT